VRRASICNQKTALGGRCRNFGGRGWRRGKKVLKRVRGVTQEKNKAKSAGWKKENRGRLEKGNNNGDS